MGLFVLAILLAQWALGQAKPLFGFQLNSGQYPPAVRFVRHGDFGGSYLTRDSFVLQNRIRIRIADIDPKSAPVGEQPLPTIYNSYQGNDPSKWNINHKQFSSVRLDGVYPGVDASFTTATLQVTNTYAEPKGKLVFSLAPGADQKHVRVRVLNTGTTPFDATSGIWFVGGNVPGVFSVSIRASQAGASIDARLKIETADALSIDVPNLDPASAAEVEISFPAYDSPGMYQAGHFITTYINPPLDFGEDGSTGAKPCNYYCSDVVAARLDDQGNPLWVSVLGGSSNETSSYTAAMETLNGVFVAGVTESSDFPVTANAPYPKAGNSVDVFLTLLDSESGRMINATHGGLQKPALGWTQTEIVDPAGDAAVGGGLSVSQTETRGYILRWQPAENRFVQRLDLDETVIRLAFDAESNLCFASAPYPAPAGHLLVGIYDQAGRVLGKTVRINLPENRTGAPAWLLPATGGDVWTLYESHGDGSPYYIPSSVHAVKVSTTRGEILLERRLALGGLDDTALTSNGYLKALVRTQSYNETTTFDAQLTGACRDTSYYVLMDSAGQLIYASYVPRSGFDFNAQTENPEPPNALIGCFTSAAAHFPADQAAPGQLITIIGGGYGPADAVLTEPDADGRYPLTAAGFRVRLDGQDLPVIAVRRGMITVQVPYETHYVNPPATLEVLENDVALNTIPVSWIPYFLTLFDNGERESTTELPVLVALNEDGSLNSRENPATAGSIVSLLGSGLGVLEPPLKTGVVNPLDAPVSTSALYRFCYGCSEVVALESAPGQPSGVDRVKVRIPADAKGSGVWAHRLGANVKETRRYPPIVEPAGVVFIKASEGATSSQPDPYGKVVQAWWSFDEIPPSAGSLSSWR